jgi:hypothetical protein
MTLAEILAALNGLEDADAAVDALRADNGAVVKAFRSKVFAQGKKEGTKDLKAVEDERDQLKASITEKDTEIEGLKAKTPDKDAIEAPLKAKITKLEQQASEQAQASQGRIRKLLRERDLGTFRQLLTGMHPDAAKHGITRQLDPDYADVVANQMEAAGRFRYNDKDELEVLDDDGVPYPVTDAKAPRSAALAAALNKAAPDKWATSKAQGGGGVGGQGSGTGYDPVAAGKKMAEEQKATPDNSLAFK